MSNTFGHFLRVTTFGESHGPAVGAVIDGLPSGLPVDLDSIQRELDRRRPGKIGGGGEENPFSSTRNELDLVEILSGVAEGKTLGTPISLVIKNRDVRQNDYAPLRGVFRPGHADYTYYKKYGVWPEGGGRASGRETAARVAAAAVVRPLLAKREIDVVSYTVGVGPVKAERREVLFSAKDPLRFADPERAMDAFQYAMAAKEAGDSVGGVVELVIKGVPVGLGEPIFCKLDAILAGAMMSIGGVKGVEVGDGFALASMRGSEANDAMEEGRFVTNRAGGILGGLATGEPIIMRLSVKPTPSISRPQMTTNIRGESCEVSVKGRHDVCLCARIGPVAEAMATLVIGDMLLRSCKD